MRLPPLNAVRTFEVAGRLANFSKAAAELNVTPGAVSRQVRKLEDHLGIRLFAREGTEVKLTEHGRTYLASVQDSFRRLESATRNMDAQQAAHPLHIWGSRYFIRLWLVPRLPDFHLRFPDQEVIISPALPGDPMPGDVDVAIRLGREERSDLTSDLLMRCAVRPMCSPTYLRSSPPLERPQDLEHHALLQTPGGAEDWSRWYAISGAPAVPMLHRMTFSSTDIAYSAALDGVGIVLGRRGFFEADEQKGNLVAPFDRFYESPEGFYLIYRNEWPRPLRINRFRTWMMERLGEGQAPPR
jgi:LysR family glycine cleavage system transcriptional activator